MNRLWAWLNKKPTLADFIIGTALSTAFAIAVIWAATEWM